MTNYDSNLKKGKDKKRVIDDLKEMVIKGEIQLKDILDAINGNEKEKTSQKKGVIEIPIPASGPTELEEDSSRSEPFSDSPRSDLEEEYGDVLNRGIMHEYSTERSVVTKENQHIERKVDPFMDKNKIVGGAGRNGNPPSRAPIQMRPADNLELFSNEMTSGMNTRGFDEKLKNRKALLLREGLIKEKLEPKGPTSEDLELRQELRKEKERAEIDTRRRALKEPEPNMINTENGEWSDVWRNWFDRRLGQIEEWLLEDATTYNHLPPSVECEPPRGVKVLATDWNVIRRNEVEVAWDYEKYGPMRLTDNMAYDGTKLYNPITGRTWSNIIEVLETEVKKKYEALNPGTDFNVFEVNDGFFWSTLLQQWYDIINVSKTSHFKIKYLNTFCIA